MKLLVTGAGIVGSQIARLLVGRGDAVVLFDIAPQLQDIASIVDTSVLTVVQGDVTDMGALEKIVAEHAIDNVVHTAALLTRPAQEAPARAVAVNIGGSINILELARRRLVKRVVLAGSTTVAYSTFGNMHEPGPIREDYLARIGSQSPQSFYSATKLAMEFMLHNYIDSFGIDAAVVRYGAVIGAWSGPNVGMVSRMIQALLGPASSGKTAILEETAHVWNGVEEFVDARDCAAGTVAALDAPSLPSRVYHISNARAYTHGEFLDAVRSVYPDLRIEQRVEPRGGFANFPYLRPDVSDIARARDELGFVAQYSLADSLRHFSQIIHY